MKGKMKIKKKSIQNIYGAVIEGKENSNISSLADLKEPKYKKIPFRLIEEALLLFRMQYHKEDSEAAVLITYDEDIDEFELAIPVQDVSGGHVSFWNKGKSIIKNVVGSIHSHCEMPGFFSETDKQDNKENPGLHIVIGKIMSEPQFSVEFSFNKFDVRKPDITDVVEDFIENAECLLMPDFISNKTLGRIEAKSYGSSYFGKGQKYGHY